MADAQEEEELLYLAGAAVGLYHPEDIGGAVSVLIGYM